MCYLIDGMYDGPSIEAWDALNESARTHRDLTHRVTSLDQRGERPDVKVSCIECGYCALVAQSWLTKLGPPICPCGETMKVTNNSPNSRVLREETPKAPP